jgi:hypothetical protein
MKALLSKTVVVAVALFVLTTWVRAQSGSDMPPGIDQARWLPLSDSAGILLTDVPSTSPRATYRFEGNEPVVIPDLQQGTGVLIAKLNGLWTRVDLSPPPARAQRLQH